MTNRRPGGMKPCASRASAIRGIRRDSNGASRFRRSLLGSNNRYGISENLRLRQAPLRHRAENEKRALVTSRLHSILTEHGFTSFSQYFDYVISDKTGQAAIAMMNKITTNHTYFMREPEHFDYLKTMSCRGLNPSPRGRRMCAYGAPAARLARSRIRSP